MATYPRGKPTSPARPGKIIKEVLLGKRPLVTGELVEEAAIVDLCNVYKNFIYEVNQTRDTKSKLKGMVYSSFLRLFKFCQLLNLVVLVREEPMLYPPPGARLYSVRKRETNGMRVFAVVSKRRVFKLTDIGREDDRSWTDLCRAWREQWAAPVKIEEPVVVEEEIVVEVPVEALAPVEITIEAAPPPKAKRGRPPGVAKVEEVEVPRLKLEVKPSPQQFVTLLAHLTKLNDIGIANKKVQDEVKRLARMVGEWVAEASEAVQRAHDRGIAREVIELQYLRDSLIHFDEALLDANLPSAIEQLEKIAKRHVRIISQPTTPTAAAPVEPELTPKTPKTKPKAREHELGIDELKSYLTDMMDEEKKAASIKKLEGAMAKLDYDKYIGLDDLESAIEEYKNAEREDKESAFEDVMNTIDEIELAESEEE